VNRDDTQPEFLVRAMARPTLEEQIVFQRTFRDLVRTQPEVWPEGELEYADAILESLERLNDLER
jgi:hypothetical protein